MKIALSTINPVMVLDKSKKPWEMNGNKGVVYTAVCHKKVDDEVQVEKVRITEDVYNVIEPMKEYHFYANVDVKNSRMEVYYAYPATGEGNPKNSNAEKPSAPVDDKEPANTSKASTASK